MIESVAIITLAAVVVVQAVILACRRERKPIEWKTARDIAKSIVRTFQRGVAEGEANSVRKDLSAQPSEFYEPLKDDDPYDADEELADSRVGPDPDLVQVTDAPLEA